MSWFNPFSWHHNNNATTTPKDPEAAIKGLMRSAPKTGNSNIDANHDMKQELLGSFKKGGKVKKTGPYKLHKGEEVIPKKKVDMAKKMSARDYESGVNKYAEDMKGKDRRDFIKRYMNAPYRPR